ncbi:DUF3857 and transglutaminase domain-containing protein [uncultured Photobacterium sp.]|uniref:DUF3857 domain-containing transglutaminase family protein n=1 Tax=uncultured Photobacterium sp. TaxID=173973 RepID=UPI002615F8F8|nr:DUF3857 and transglutaminase domain-containing protein [uncultured Photobacterium sp.]
MKIMPCLLCSLTVLLAANQAVANESIKWKLSDSGRLLDTADAYRGQKNRPDEVTLVMLANDIQFKKNKVIQHIRELWYYPTARDIENHGDHSIYFNEKMEKLTLLSAASVDKNGVVTSLSPSSAQLLDTDSYRSFSDSKEVVLTIPGLSDGSLTVLEYEIERDRSKQEADWSEVFFSQRNHPITTFELSIQWPADHKLYWSPNSRDVECEGSSNRLRCSGSNIPAFENDANISWRDHIGQITIGELQNWQQVIDNSNTAMSQALKDTSGVQELLERILTDSEENLDEKISRLHEFVARDIRYVSMSELGHAITPHSIASVIKNRYGDCKDKSMLLSELLRRIGIKSYLTLVATNRSAPNVLSIPTMRYFDHVVVCFDRQGSQYCLDATDKDTYWKYTPSWIQNKVALPLKPAQMPTIITNSRYRWEMDISTQITFRSDGGQNERQERQYHGVYASSMRTLLLNKTAKEQTEWLTAQYHNEVSTLTEPVFNIPDLNKMAPNLVVYSDAEINPFLNTKNSLTYDEYDAWLKDELEMMRLSNKHSDEHFAGLKIHSEYKYDTQGIWEISNTPAILNFENDFGTMRRQTALTPDGKLLVSTELAIPEQTIRQDQIKSFNAFLNLLNRESLIRFTGKLTKAQKAVVKE